MADSSAAVVVTDRRHSARRELRDPTAATLSTGWQARGLPMVPEWDAAQAIRWAYQANTIVYRCVQTIAQALSRVPFRVGADPDKPQDYDRRPTAGLGRLLSPPPFGPNQETSARQLWAWTVAQYLVTGRFGWENELAQGSDQVVGLWPLPATSLHAIPSAGGSRYFDRFEFGNGASNQRRRLQVEQVTYGWRPSPSDWREPESVLQAARLDVSVAVMQDRYDYAFLRNGARPDFLLVHEAIDDDDERQAFRDQFEATHRGPDNAGKPAFAEYEGDASSGAVVDVKQLGLSQRDQQAIERQKAKVLALCIAFGTPLSKLGDSSERTFNNAGVENRNWWEDTVQPLGTELADIVNIKLAPRLGSNVGWFDWSKVPALQPERKVALVGPPALVSGRIATVNEGRELVGLPGIGPEGDVLVDEQPAPDLQAAAGAFAALVQAGADPASAASLTGFDGIVMRPPAPAPAAVQAPRSRPDGQREPAPDAASDSSPEQQAQAAAARRDARWAQVNTRAENLEKAWERGFRRLFDKQQKATLSRLNGKRGRQWLRDLTPAEGRAADDPAPQVDPTDIFDPTFWTDDTRELAAGLYESVATLAGTEVTDAHGLSFDLEAPFVQEFIQARSNQLAGQVTDTTYSAIRDALAQGVADGLSIDDLADAVRHVFQVASDARATVIARTEVISAYNGAGQVTAAQLGPDVVAAQEWIATRDPRTREAHADADGQIVLIGRPFTVDGEDLAYPGDPNGRGANTIQCRCTIGYLTPDDLPEDMRRRQVDVRTAQMALRLTHVVTDLADFRSRLRAAA